MDNISTRKWSEIRNLAVVTLTDGKKVGTVEDFYFDPHTNSVRALLIKTGMFGHQVLLVSSIQAFGQDAITASGENALIKEKKDAQLSTMPLGQTLLTYKVMSEGGSVVGTIGNLLFDLSTPGVLRVAAFEMAAGLRERISGHYPTFEAQRVLRYGQDVMVIPDAIALELSK